jgi:hypothetical protein
MRNYMEKGVVPLKTMCKASHAILVMIPRMRKEMKMILERAMRRFGCMRILNT